MSSGSIRTVHIRIEYVSHLTPLLHSPPLPPFLPPSLLPSLPRPQIVLRHCTATGNWVLFIDGRYEMHGYEPIHTPGELTSATPAGTCRLQRRVASRAASALSPALHACSSVDPLTYCLSLFLARFIFNGWSLEFNISFKLRPNDVVIAGERHISAYHYC